MLAFPRPVQGDLEGALGGGPSWSHVAPIHDMALPKKDFGRASDPTKIISPISCPTLHVALPSCPAEDTILAQCFSMGVLLCLRSCYATRLHFYLPALPQMMHCLLVPYQTSLHLPARLQTFKYNISIHSSWDSDKLRILFKMHLLKTEKQSIVSSPFAFNHIYVLTQESDSKCLDLLLILFQCGAKVREYKSKAFCSGLYQTPTYSPYLRGAD